MESRITLHGRNFKLMIPGSDIEAAVDKVADRLNKDFANTPEDQAPIMLCILNGAVVFFADLLKRLDFPCEVRAFRLSSYQGTSSTGTVKMESALSGVEGRTVIVVEDIVDTGTSIVAMNEYLKTLNVKEVRICTMLLKPEVYKKDLKLDYVAMEIPNKFIVGYGLDYDQLGRNTKDIYVLDE